MRRLSIVASVYLVASTAFAVTLMPFGKDPSPGTFATPREDEPWRVPKERAAEIRDLALQQARVWTPTDPAAADLAANAPDPTGFLSGELVRCRYLNGPATGTSPKFDCVLPDGEVVKVKYGDTGEIPAEIAASRLLTALGFGADRMYLVPRVRCYGCLRWPYQAAWLLDYAHARDLALRHLPGDRYTDFEWVSVERHFDGKTIETPDGKGWAWYEFDRLDPASGANRAERDALRLASMVIAHWDNKQSNQRLVCRADAAATDVCPQPFALIQDLGATFGPSRVDLAQWKREAIWKDRARCTVTMHDMPYDGATFPDWQISEEGRQLLARQLRALGDPQLVSLFASSRFAEFSGHTEGRNANAWARVLREKINDIVDGPACPPIAPR